MCAGRVLTACREYCQVQKSHPVRSERGIPSVAALRGSRASSGALAPRVYSATCHETGKLIGDPQGKLIGDPQGKLIGDPQGKEYW